MDSPTSRAADTRYRIIDLLATGGMAEVYRAEATGLGGFKKRVAIKRVKKELVNEEKFVHMFLDEARLGARLSHGNCVQVFDVSQAHDPSSGEPRYFLVMEYVDGASLRRLATWAQESCGAFPTPLAAFIVMQMCQGLAYAHELEDDNGRPLGIVHRDVSPANVLITRHGEVKLADFGLAKAATHLSRNDNDVIKGKFPYLAPETVRQLDLDGRADLFATGAILWELLAGRKLFQGETPAQTVALVERAEVPSLRALNPTVDGELDAIVRRSLARERDDRFGSARDMMRALVGWLAHTGQGVSALDLAELVASYREHRTQGSGLLAIGAALTEVQQELAAMDSVCEATPQWSQEIPGFKPRPTQDGMHLGWPSLHTSAPEPAAALTAQRRLRRTRAALGGVTLALVLAMLALALVLWRLP